MKKLEKKEYKKEEEIRNKNILENKKKKEDLEKYEIKENKIENNDEIIYKINKYENKVKIFGEDFVKNNSDKFEIIYKNITYKITEYLDAKEEEEEVNNLYYRFVKIKLKGINNVIDMSFMLYKCSSLLSLPDISRWDTNNITNMRYMFYECSHLCLIFQNGILVMLLI